MRIIDLSAGNSAVWFNRNHPEHRASKGWRSGVSMHETRAEADAKHAKNEAEIAAQAAE